MTPPSRRARNSLRPVRPGEVTMVLYLAGFLAAAGCPAKGLEPDPSGD